MKKGHIIPIFIHSSLRLLILSLFYREIHQKLCQVHYSKSLDTAMTYSSSTPNPCVNLDKSVTARRFGTAVGGAEDAAGLVTPIPWYPNVNWQFSRYYLYLYLTPVTCWVSGYFLPRNYRATV